ncbi:hypothetical protein EVG20_g9008 [Dentipellis fragilis]|uniref:HhH-GPD domain-containing protein n=1 Tax=Dentipellis fragilis TaxID=205917 RepID=A0A4Y9Y1K0_9AGAM|nr:hypothetical protein EVG20_g9008 [Dentipellis fragilis]
MAAVAGPEGFALRMSRSADESDVECVADDPWRVLVAVMLLNKTAGRIAIPIFWTIMERWPSAEAMSGADLCELRECIRSLGLQDRRARRLIALSRAYVEQPPIRTRPRLSRYYSDPSLFEADASDAARRQGTQRLAQSPISHLPGSGPYAVDSYRIFCGTADEWRYVAPTDKELVRYLVRNHSAAFDSVA